MKIIIAIIIFSLIIIIHELGHFLLAKKNGVGVTEFSVGLGPRIASFERGNTRYSLKLLPFGGSCMMLGEDELLDDDAAFNKKSVWARISVIAAGPIFNFILAFVLALFVIGIAGYDPAEVLSVENNSAAEIAGLKKGDVITKLDGGHINFGREISTYLQFTGLDQDPIDITYKREGSSYKTTLNPIKSKTYLLGFTYQSSDNPATIETLSKDLPLEQAGLQIGDNITAINGQEIKSGQELNAYIQNNPLGESEITVTYKREGLEKSVTVQPKLTGESYKTGFTYNVGRVKTSPLGVVRYSAAEVKYWIVTTVKSLGQMVTGKVKKDDIAGPVGIVNIIGDAYEQSKQEGIIFVFLQLAYISILLSANLGVMNLLPIPALDGGRLVFLLIEAVRGKPIDQEKEGMVHAIGLIVLMFLMVLIMFNDITKLFR